MRRQANRTVDPIDVTDYDPSWPRWFERERERLVGALGDVAVTIEHVGSTAVPGLAAKRVLDILMTAEPFPLPEPAIAAIEALGYRYRGENGIPGRQYFRTVPHARHLHVYAPGHPDVERTLLFRDYLRTHPEAAREYEALKRTLAERYPLDRGAYTEGKRAFVAAIVERAGVGRLT
ncbi:MAG: GrpB family protein [Dehalococcoidia bacterium]